MQLRTLMAWLRGEPLVCSMVPIPDEVDEEARRAHREREDLIGERLSIVNKIDGILATLGVKGCRALRRDCREQVALLRQPDGAEFYAHTAAWPGFAPPRLPVFTPSLTVAACRRIEEGALSTNIFLL
jgi:transposase